MCITRLNHTVGHRSASAQDYSQVSSTSVATSALPVTDYLLLLLLLFYYLS